MQVGSERRIAARVCNCASMCVSSLPPRSKMDEAILHSPCFCFPPSQAEKERRRIRVRGHIRGVLTSVHITVAQWTLVLYRVHFGWTVAAGISNLLGFYTKSNLINALSQLRGSKYYIKEVFCTYPHIFFIVLSLNYQAACKNKTRSAQK